MNRDMTLPATPSPSRNGLVEATRPTPPFSHGGDWATRRCVLLTVSPAQAREILAARNPANRPISPANLAYLRAELRDGRWAVNGATLVFDPAGDLVDGQHRLRACVAEDLPIETYVLFGVDPGAFETIDRGRSRKAGDDLHVRGEKNVANLAATLVLLYLDDLGRLEHVGHGHPPARLLRETLDRHPDVRNYCSLIASNKPLRKVLNPRLASYCYYAFSRKDQAAAYRFFDDLSTGAGLERGDPVLLLRNRLMGARGDAKTDLKPVEALALTIKAWNYRRAGTSVANLRWIHTGEHPESFPTIK